MGEAGGQMGEVGGRGLGARLGGRRAGPDGVGGDGKQEARWSGGRWGKWEGADGER